MRRRHHGWKRIEHLLLLLLLQHLLLHLTMLHDGGIHMLHVWIKVLMSTWREWSARKRTRSMMKVHIVTGNMAGLMKLTILVSKIFPAIDRPARIASFGSLGLKFVDVRLGGIPHLRQRGGIGFAAAMRRRDANFRSRWRRSIAHLLVRHLKLLLLMMKRLLHMMLMQLLLRRRRGKHGVRHGDPRVSSIMGKML